MEINWIISIAAVILLWIPASVLYSAEARDLLSEHRGSRIRPAAIFATWQHWLDGLRGGAGSFFLIHEGVVFVPGEELYFQVFTIHAVILTVAVALQTLQYRTVFYCIAPIGFVIGLTFAVSDWQAAAFATVFGLLMLKVGSLELKLFVMAGLLGVVGYFVSWPDIYLILNCGLLIWPLVLTYVSRNTFVIYSRGLVR